ncbi:hypothetical protein J5069_11560 [Candidatus Symbiopectobacterium sp. NZEC127]|uniref:EH signature domain-containing protein n=1 Tax=Candidatus Symbiopectobacterium sp. NZEC127 TaxID=2820472 RepID=UPI002226EF1B|nr:EH signature domain-containing protein [Candidatus Symbiopectobacterium sp. NZEC127]MCW2486531.1 hypothetical protein [Candidatus Symbiopectobacterium sp. NZEC127]
MNEALRVLASKLHSSIDIGTNLTMTDGNLDKHIAALQQHVQAGSSPHEPEDLQAQAVRRFWDAPRFDNLKDARLVSFGMCLPSRPNGPCIMEDRERFQAVLSSDTGVEQWVDEPRWFRRCYQGLVRSYFSYDDSKGRVAPKEGRRNWRDLRDYLHDRSPKIIDAERLNPDWVTTATENKNLFSQDPCSPYAESALSGETATIDRIREQLGITDDSWFINELIRSQVRHAVSLPYGEFKDLVPSLLTMLVNLAQYGIKVRNYGLIRILDTYAQARSPAIHEQLRDVSVRWWGNPWLPSTAAQWGGVTPKAREMVAEWLRGEFIEAFFTKLAEDGVGDRRRANFWLRYVKSMTNVQFALGSQALNSRSRDFIALLEKMKGLYTNLKDTNSANNAFIMTLGNLVAVEFGSMGNALYMYRADALPFIFNPHQPLCVASQAQNSLKNKTQSVLTPLRHQDGIHGWSRWEDRFESILRESFQILPDSTLRHPIRAAVSSKPAPSTLSSKYGSFEPYKLRVLGESRGIDIADLRSKGGNIWAYTDSNDPELIQIFQDWGFQYRAGKGWWK